MTKSLIIYSSTDGQTKKICERIMESVITKSSVNLVSINEALNLNMSTYEKIIIGASIRYGRYNSLVLKFVNKNLKILQKKYCAFFSVNVVARKENKNTPESNPYIRKFFARTDWKPNLVSVFAGKVDYPNYNFLNKFIIKFIMFITKGPTDTSMSYEFTDWDKVKLFADKINIENK